MDTIKLPNKKYKIETLFLSLALVFGLLTLFVQPIFAAPDEFTHFKHAYSIFHDDTDEIFAEVGRLTVSIPYEGPALNENALNSPDSSFVFESAYKDGSFLQKYFVDQVPSQGYLGLNLSFSNLQWFPQAIGILIGSWLHASFGVMIILGRLLNFLVYLFAIYFAIKKAKFGKWLMAAVALLPISIQQAASLSYDVLYYVSVFVCFSLMTNLWTRKEQLTSRHYLYLGLTAILLFVPKSAVLVLGVYFVTLPTRLFGQNKLTKIIDNFWGFWSKYKKLALLSILIFFYALFVYEFRQAGGAIRGFQIMFNTFFRPDFYNNMDSILVSGMIGNFGQMTYRLPAWLVVINFVFLFLLGVSEKEVYLDKRISVSSGISFVLVILMTAIMMYMSWTLNHLDIAGALISLGNQGRYYTPFLIILTPLALSLKKYIKVEMTEAIKIKVFKYITVFNLVYFLLLTVLFYYIADRGANLLPDSIAWLKNLI
ncbi:DUF2142 domain-containing protein [Lactococcus garvieae]|uniref:DUF2142 domain-containing protein n=1 Tax=Lactococcus garvieae TaxID=1363 RepID=UPI001A8D79D7|nr:DUF2142 domain-containing protein [Lactococcus garvieae]QSR00357.1 DUF2142 domain-containing protein [Lactococcus garvieae]